MSDRNYSALPSHLRFNARGNDAAVSEVEAGIRAGLRPIFAEWERQGAADGDLPGVGVLYVPTGPEGPAGKPAPFVDALLACWDVWARDIMPGWQIVPQPADPRSADERNLDQWQNEWKDTYFDLRSDLYGA